MATTTQNITITDHHVHAEEDRTVRHDVKDSADAAQTMTGWALQWVLYKGATVVFTKTTGGGGITIGNGAGTDDRATVTLTSANLTGLEGTYYYELARTDTGNKLVLAKGFVQIEDSQL